MDEFDYDSEYCDDPDLDPSFLDDEEDSDFAEPGGNSALRAATPENPRIYPCPDCGVDDRLTLKDVNLGYCCDSCADRNERGF